MMVTKPTLDRLIANNPRVDRQKLTKTFEYLKELEYQGISDEAFSIPIAKDRLKQNKSKAVRNTRLGEPSDS